MKKNTDDFVLKEIFKTLATGNRDEIKKTKKQIEVLWRKDRKSFQKTGGLILGIIKDFDNISDPEHKAAVISGMSLFCLALSDKYFNELKDFILKNLQNPDGRIREAARRTGDWLYMSLTSRADPFIYPEGKQLNKSQEKDRVIAIEQYRSFVSELGRLIEHYEKEDKENRQIEYIDEMKPSINKSLQMVWSRLVSSRVYQKIIEQTRPIPMEIFVKRKEIEVKINQTLKESKSDFNLEDIKEIIYNEEGPDDLTEIIAMFDRGQDIAKLQEILELVNDAWNYFPHKILDGLSPTEKMLEYIIPRGRAPR